MTDSLAEIQVLITDCLERISRLRDQRANEERTLIDLAHVREALLRRATSPDPHDCR